VTAKTYRSLARYVDAVAAEFGLRDWTICILDEPPGTEGASATCEPIFGRRLANLRFARHFFHASPEDQRETVIHELLHCHLAATDQAFADSVRLHGVEAQAVASNAYNTTREYAVDAIAAAIADRYPLWEG
jgi:hypothetical protein